MGGWGNNGILAVAKQAITQSFSTWGNIMRLKKHVLVFPLACSVSQGLKGDVSLRSWFLEMPKYSRKLRLTRMRRVHPCGTSYL